MKRRMNQAVNGVCGAACLGLGENPIPQETVTKFLQRIGSMPIKYNNSSPPRNQALLSQSQVNCVEDIFVKRDTVNLGMSRR